MAAGRGRRSGGRRRPPPGLGRAPGSRPSTATGRRRRRRPRPRRRPAARRRRRSSARWPRRGAPRRRDPGRAGRRDRQAGRRRIGRRDRRPDRARRAPRRRRARAAPCSGRRWRPFPADGPRTFTDEAALLEACSIPVHVVPGEPANLKVTVPDGPRAGSSARLGDGAGATRIGFGHDSHPFGPGEPARAGRRRRRRRAAPARPLGRRRGAPRGRRCAPRRSRAGRPRPARSRPIDADPARRRQHGVARRRSWRRARRTPAGARVSVDLTIVGRATAAGATRSTRSAAIARPSSGSRRTRST